jgi:transcriptional regulator with XRE-family HTH domain
MVIPIYERLKAVRTALQLSQKDFAQAICTSQSFYARLERGVIQVNDRIIELVCYKYGVRKEYLKDGKGEMFVDKLDTQLRQLERIYNELNGIFQDYLLVQAKELLNVQKRGKKQH